LDCQQDTPGRRTRGGRIIVHPQKGHYWLSKKRGPATGMYPRREGISMHEKGIWVQKVKNFRRAGGAFADWVAPGRGEEVNVRPSRDHQAAQKNQLLWMKRGCTSSPSQGP